jgi:hypothetical protein
MSLSDPAKSFAAITPDDVTNFPGGIARTIYVGGSGDVAVVGADDVAVVFVGAQGGGELNVICKRINATGTTATDLVALF